MSKRHQTPHAKQSTLFRRTAIASLLSLATSAHGAIVTDGIDYQYFRDFAENKGKFTVGANRIEITDKKGASRGQLFPKGDAGMPDLAVTSNNGVSHLINPQYIASVKHNTGYGEVQFAPQRGNHFVEQNFNYLLVARNDKPNSGKNGEWTTKDDYHIPRLHKLVTESAPIPILRLTGNDLKLLADRERFPYIVRRGSGKQMVRPATGDDIFMADAYSYGIGGNVMNNVSVQQDNHVFFIGVDDKQAAANTSQYGPLPTITLGGDSGSPVFAYDAKEKQWVAIAVHHAGDGVSRNWTVLHQPDFIDNLIAGDKVVLDNKVKGSRLTWQPADKTSVISSSHDKNLHVNVNLRDASLAKPDETRFRNDLNHGKTLHITGKEGTLQMGANIHQGAGALYFDNNFTVIGASNETTWLGAGVSVAEGKTVNWQVHNPEGDRLSKVGSGSLNVSGVGVNKGKISVGEGKVLLNQRADAKGQKQAFSEVHITSGRPTVVLGDAEQVNPDNIVFGFRGGRLDVNGNDVSFTRLRSVDSGAKIVNHHLTKTANVNYVGSGWKTDDVQILNWSTRADSGKLGVYQYPRYGGSYIEYFRLKDGATPNAPFPTDGKSNDNWEYLVRDNRDAAIKRVLDDANKATQFFEGQLGESDGKLRNGKLNFTYRPQDSAGRLVLNGGMNLNGNVTVADGTLMLSGSPVPHAYDFKNKKDVVFENDWVGSHFTANVFQVTGGTLSTSRDVKTITGDINANQTGRVNLGFANGETDVCYRSDVTGKSHCSKQAIASNLLTPLTVNGHVSVRDQAQLNMVNTHVSGSLNAHQQANIILKNKATAKEVKLHDTAKLNFANKGDILNTKVSGSRNSQVAMNAGSHWRLPENTTIGHLFGDVGSEISLSPTGTPQVFQQLTLNGNLSGNVKFNFASNLGAGKADKLVVHGYANGKHEIAVRHTGAEAKVDELTLIELKNNAQKANDVAFSLQGGYVDAGALRYTLENDSAKRYYLFNREKANGIIAKREVEVLKAATAKAKAKQDLADAIAVRERAEKDHEAAEQALLAAQGQTTAKSSANRLQAASLAKAQTNTALSEAKAKEEEAKRLAAEAERERLAQEAAAKQAAEAAAQAAKQKQAEVISQYSNTALSEVAAQAHQMQRVSQRIDERLRDLNGANVGAWAQTDTEKSKHASDQYRAFEQDSQLTQMGVDKTINTENGQITVGGALNHLRYTADYADNFSGKGHSTSGTIYSKWQAENGLGLHGDVSYGRVHSKLKQANQAQSEVKRHIASAGVGVLKDWQAAGVEIQAHAGARYHHLGEANYAIEAADGRAVQVQQDGTGIVSYQAGAHIGKTMQTANGLKVRPNFGLAYRDSNRDAKVKINDHTLTQKFAAEWESQAGIGFSKNNWEVSLKANYAKGNESGYRKSAFIGVSSQW